MLHTSNTDIPQTMEHDIFIMNQLLSQTFRESPNTFCYFPGLLLGRPDLQSTFSIMMPYHIVLQYRSNYLIIFITELI